MVAQRPQDLGQVAEQNLGGGVLLALPGSVWGEPLAAATPAGLPSIRFADPDPFQEIAFPSAVAAKRAIADFLGVPLAKLAA